ncbi:MAG: hypothetical protein P4L53_05380 [Candidatus Obscuribacterales bacterium]|nr:hypothetical protein [Candidatus Obscuribacterales bacterium]
MNHETSDFIALAVLVAATISAFLLPWAFWRWVIHCKTSENPNWELEDKIRDCLNWAEGLKMRSGFGDQVESSKLELESAIAAAKVALAPESRITEAWVLRAIHARLNTRCQSIAKVLPIARDNDFLVLG